MPPAVPEPTNQFQTNFKNPFHNNIQSKAKALRLPDKNAAMGVDFFSTFRYLCVVESSLEKAARVNRKVISVVNLHDDNRAVRYWRRQSPRKRLEGLEWLRQSVHPYDPVASRLQRFLTVAQRKRH
jgi:hypothetical protein